MINATSSVVNLYYRTDTGGGSTTVNLYRNANGTAFASATSSIATATFTPVVNTVFTVTLNSLTLNQFDSLHFGVTSSTSPGQVYGIVTIQ